MAKRKHVVHLSEVPVDRINAPDGSVFSGSRQRVGAQIDAQKLGYSFFTVPPGKTAFPYHNPVGNEEMIYIIEGRRYPAPRQGRAGGVGGYRNRLSAPVIFPISSSIRAPGNCAISSSARWRIRIFPNILIPIRSAPTQPARAARNPAFARSTCGIGM